MNVLSIHSHVSVGHIGNGAVEFVLRRLGHEVWPVHTVLLAHHPGHGGWHGPRVAAGDVAGVIDGLDGHGVLERSDAVLTGYVGDAGVADVALATWARVRAANPDALIACDPILGDEAEGLYVAEELVAFYRDKAVPTADVIFPNRFELALLSGADVTGPDSAAAAARSLISGGPGMVLATSVPSPDGLATVLVTADRAVYIPGPELKVRAKGAGDAFAALWLGRYLNNRDGPEAALSAAVADIQTIMEKAAGGNYAELPLIATQDQWARPAGGTPAVRSV